MRSLRAFFLALTFPWIRRTQPPNILRRTLLTRSPGRRLIRGHRGKYASPAPLIDRPMPRGPERIEFPGTRGVPTAKQERYGGKRRAEPGGGAVVATSLRGANLGASEDP